MIVHARKRDRQEVIDVFQSHFLWFGVPDHPLRRSPTPTSGKALIHPSKQVISTLLPSLLSTIPTTSLQSFHSSYLSIAPNLPPILAPDAHIHGPFLSAISHHLGPDSAIDAINRIIEAGYDPGIFSYTHLLLSLVGRDRGRSAEMFQLLKEMENGSVYGPIGKERRLPEPSKTTYKALETLFRNRHDEASAKEVERMRRVYLREEEEESLGSEEGHEDHDQRLSSTG